MRAIKLTTSVLMFLGGFICLIVCADSMVREWWGQVGFSGSLAVVLIAFGMAAYADWKRTPKWR